MLFRSTLDDLIALFHAVPNLQDLRCELLLKNPSYRCRLYPVADIFNVLSRIPGLLSNLQSLVICSHRSTGIVDHVWEYIPKIFSQSHRKLLTLMFEVTDRLHMHRKDLDTVLQLVDEGFDIRIFECGRDYLQKDRAERTSLPNPPT